MFIHFKPDPTTQRSCLMSITSLPKLIFEETDGRGPTGVPHTSSASTLSPSSRDMRRKEDFKVHAEPKIFKSIKNLIECAISYHENLRDSVNDFPILFIVFMVKLRPHEAI